MELKINQFGTQEIEGTVTGTKKMRLSENAQSMVFQMFTKNVYSNQIGSVVREITSNCFDSHVEAGSKDPVIIKLSYDNETRSHYISFIDFGVGMSPDRVQNVYGVYFESTKRATNDQIGGFGIGGKTPLAYLRRNGEGENDYDNSFFVITNFDGIKYNYLIHEGAESPEISLLHSEETTDRNGSEIRIPVLANDINKFAKEINKQLHYFENVVFEGFENYNGNVTNDYKIHVGKTFLYRTDDIYNTYDDCIHICLGRVAYPIDYSILGLDRYEHKLPVAIKLNVGEIGVTVARESLDYTDVNIAIIKKKLAEVKNELRELISKQYDNVQTLAEYFEAIENFGYLKLDGSDVGLKVTSIINKNEISFSNFKYNELSKIPESMEMFNLFFKTKGVGSISKRRYNNGDNGFKGGIKHLHTFRSKLYYVNEDFKSSRVVLKQSYLKSIHNTYYIIEKSDLMDSFDIKNHSILDTFNKKHIDIYHEDTLDSIKNNSSTVSSYPSRDLTDFMAMVLEMQEEYFKLVKQYATSYDDLEVPENFIVQRKRRNLSDDVLKTTIPVTTYSPYPNRYRIKIEDIVKSGFKVFYGDTDEVYKIKHASQVTSKLFNTELIQTYYDYSNEFENPNKHKKQGLMFISVSKSNIRKLKYISNAFHIDEVYHRLLYRKADDVSNYMRNIDFITAYKNFYDNGNSVTNVFVSESMAYINEDLCNKIKDVETYFKQVNTDAVCSLSSVSNILSRFYTFDTTKTANTINYINKLNEIIQIRQNNEATLNYIEIPWRLAYVLNDSKTDVLLNILKKVMVF